MQHWPAGLPKPKRQPNLAFAAALVTAFASLTAHRSVGLLALGAVPSVYTIQMLGQVTRTRLAPDAS